MEPVSALYRDVWGPLMNFFLPGLKLKEKWREKSAWKKRYEPARTAYQRLMDAGVLDRRQRRELRERYESLDPFALKRALERGLQPILAGAVDERHRPQGVPPPGRIDSHCRVAKDHATHGSTTPACSAASGVFFP